MNKSLGLILNKLKIVGFSLYSIILFGERLAAVIYSVNYGEEYALTSRNVFNYIAYFVTVISLIAGLILFIRPLIEMWRALLSKELYPFETKNKRLIIAVTVLLFGGMMHTDLLSLEFSLQPMDY